jgi:hypothetical protein
LTQAPLEASSRAYPVTYGHQTEGNDVAIATAPNWNAERALSVLGVTRVEFTTMNGNAQGYAASGKQIAVNPVAARLTKQCSMNWRKWF